MLIVVDGFTWYDFFVTVIGCAVGIVVLAASITGYLFGPLNPWRRWVLALSALFFVAPGVKGLLWGAILFILTIPYKRIKSLLT